jgi:polyisoprenoid-binding protein YceI
LFGARPSAVVSPKQGRALFKLAPAFFLFLVPYLHAQESVVNLDPAQTHVEFALDSTLHTVHGTFKLKAGQIRFDPATGEASGEIVVDATSGESGNEGRDKKMHKEILESHKFPEVTFKPIRVKGSIAPQGPSQVEVSGVFRLHGQDHDMVLAISVQPTGSGQLQGTTSFAVPYVKWGLKSPNTFLLHASDTVDIEIRTIGQLAPVPASH